MRLYGADITGSLQITGSISLSGSFKDQESSPGTAGQVLSSTVSGSQWVDAADSSAITGAGTTGTITKWTTGGSVIGDSIITEAASAITVTGDGTFTGKVTADQGIFNSTANTYAGGSLILRDLNGANPMYLTSVVGNLAISNGGATDHLTILSGGDVGIGNTNPSSYHSPADNLVIGTSGDNGFTIVSGTTSKGTICFADGTSGGAQYTGFIDYDHSNDSMRLGTNGGNTRLTITSGGNVGIGTTTPSSKLSVSNPSSSTGSAAAGRLADSSIHLIDTTNIGRYSQITFGYPTSNTYASAYIGYVSTSSSASGKGDLVFGTKDNTAYNIQPTERMRISSGGNVGIGTTSPLTINGNAAAGSGLHVNASSGYGVSVLDGADGSQMFFNDRGASVNSRLWRLLCNDGSFSINAMNDNIGVKSSALTISSVGAANFISDVYQRSTLLTIDGTTANYRWQTYNNASDDAYVINSRNIGDVFKIGYTTGEVTITSTFASNTFPFRVNTSSGTNIFKIADTGATAIRMNPTSTIASLTLEKLSNSVAINDTIGYLNFFSNDASTTSTGGVGGIAVKAETSFNTSATPSYMSFYTHQNNGNDGTNIGNVTERMRITSGGDVTVNTGKLFVSNGNIIGGSASDVTGTHYFNKGASANGGILYAGSSTTGRFSLVVQASDMGYNNTPATCLKIGGTSSTSRSISAAGTVNVSGNDYAEYMTKAITDDISKGDVVGVNSDGLLTNIFSDAISFVIKSTDPSFVGGDIWGIESDDEDEIEEARIKVDRIAFSGQVPCNVTGASVGDYIIPIADSNGKITGEAISNPTFEQYKLSVGKVWKIMEDGRSWVAVKIG